MGIIVSELNPDADDLVALSVFINGLAGKTISSGQITEWRSGSLKRDYEVKTLATYDAGEAVFKLEPGKLYFYQNTGTSARMVTGNIERAKSTQVVVGDALSKEVIVAVEMPAALRGAVHTTVLSRGCEIRLHYWSECRVSRWIAWWQSTQNPRDIAQS